MFSSPSSAHESILIAFKADLSTTLRTIPAPKSALPCINSNKHFQEDSISGVPDLTIMMWGKGDRGHCEPQLLCIMESAFTQSDRDVMRKLEAYIHDLPNLLVVGKILIKQAKRYRNPRSKPTVVQWLRSSVLMSCGKWSDDYGDGEEFARIVVDGHTWFSLSLAEIHVWVHQHSAKLDLTNSDGYASGVHHFTSHISYMLC